jgi:hypothetical protein
MAAHDGTVTVHPRFLGLGSEFDSAATLAADLTSSCWSPLEASSAGDEKHDGTDTRSCSQSQALLSHELYTHHRMSAATAAKTTPTSVRVSRFEFRKHMKANAARKDTILYDRSVKSAGVHGSSRV